MKQYFCLISTAVFLLCSPPSFANDIENAINKYGGKIGIKGSAANMINSQIHKATSANANAAAGTAATANTATTTTTTNTTTTTTNTTTTKFGSLKNALQNAFSKSPAATSAAPVLPTPVTTIPGTAVPVTTALPAVAAPKQQSVKAKIGKEIWRQAKRYESKHPNKLLHQGVNSLNKTAGQP